MKVDANVLSDAQALLEANRDLISRKEEEVLNVGCSWCTNCSGIVGG